MRVTIVGAGAMGSIFAGAFQRAGNDVWLLEVNKTMIDRINEHGLMIDRRDQPQVRLRVRATDDPAEIASTDLIVFFVKGFQTGAAARLVKPLVGGGTILLTLQNGLGNEDVIRASLPGASLLIGNTIHSAMMVEPGHVAHTGVRETYIGPSEERWLHQAQTVVDTLTGSGFDVHALSSTEIRAQIWSKFVVNCGALPVAALTDLEAARITGQDELDWLTSAIIEETCRIARAEGIDLDPQERSAFTRQLVASAGGKASMVQDVEARRRTEIDTINGAAVAYAVKHQIDAPLNRAMVALIKGLELSWAGAERPQDR